MRCPGGVDMNQVTFRFYGLLNEFLSRGRQLVSFTILFAGRRSVKNAIESVGVPHLKIELIVVNGEPASFDVAIQDGDRIAAFQRSTLSICPAHRWPIFPRSRARRSRRSPFISAARSGT